MLPADLKLEHFSGYPPEARKLATTHIATLRRAPLSYLPSFLREAIEYDNKFPAERKALDVELSVLESLPAKQYEEWFEKFAKINLTPALENLDWINSPGQFVEQLSAHLWATHQMDVFRAAALEFAERVRAASPPEKPPISRLGIAVIGQGVTQYAEPLFRKLRAHGAYFSRINPENGFAQLLDTVSARAKTHAVPYGHWYIDGGKAVAHDSGITTVSYDGLEQSRALLSRKMRSEIEKPGMGPEALRTLMARMRPADLGLGESSDSVLSHFQMKVLTEGSGTQIFSTTFAQWAAREALRRAQPLTLLVRFAPRQRQRPMNELISGASNSTDLDLVGSLVDGDMGAYYNWLNQQRLPGAEQSSFLVWFEGHDQALAIGPSLPRGTTSASPAELKQLLSSVG